MLYISEANLNDYLNMKNVKYFLLGSSLGFFAACSQPPDYPDEPQLEYVGVNKNSVVQGSRFAPNDTLAILFKFTDGDGDLGNSDNTNNIVLLDSRDTTQTPYKIPPVPEQGSGNGISGEITILVPNRIGSGNICCIFPDLRVCQTDPTYKQDTFSFSIQMTDRAGNKSNIIRTETITILCQ